MVFFNKNNTLGSSFTVTESHINKKTICSSTHRDEKRWNLNQKSKSDSINIIYMCELWGICCILQKIDLL